MADQWGFYGWSQDGASALAQAHCTTCQATVTVRNGACLVGHSIPFDAIEITDSRHHGRRATTSGAIGRRPARRRTTNRVPRTRAAAPARREPAPGPPSASTPTPSAISAPAAVPAPAATPPSTPTSSPIDLVERARVGPFIEMLGFSESMDSEWIDLRSSALATEPSPPVVTPPDNGYAVARPTPPLRPTMFDRLPRLAELAAGAPAENTGTLIERMWEATDDSQGLDAFAPKSDYIDVLGRRATVRWVVAGLVVVLAAWFGAQWYRGLTPEDPTERAAAAAAEATAGAHERLTSLATIVATVADPDATGDDLNGATLVLSQLDGLNRDIRQAGQQLAASSGATPVTDRLAAAADTGIRLERRIGNALTYRLVFERAFVVPDLPMSTDLTGAADTSFELSAMIADTERAIEQLPFDSALDSHRAEAEATLAEIERISSLYVEALRAENVPGATTHAVTMTRLADDIHEQLDATLHSLALQLSDDVDSYTALVTETHDLLGG